MRTLLIIAGILLVLAFNFVLYCCIRVGAKEDRLLDVDYQNKCQKYELNEECV